jgi:hypothetical protein
LLIVPLLEATMNRSIGRILVLSILVLANPKDSSAQVRADAVGHPARPRAPFGIYAVVPVESVVAAQLKANPSMTTAQLDTYFAGFYTGLLNNPAVAGLTLQVHWDTLNPNAPADANPYFWDYVDDAFASVAQWNLANPYAPMPNPKTIQLIVTPGFNSPQWVRDQLTSCDGLFASPPVAPGSACGLATFTAFTESGDSDQLPMPWNATYQSDWKTFLTALAARYGTNSSLVSIAVAGPTAASAEMLLPNGDEANQTQFSGGAISPNSMWDQLLANFYGSSMPAYLMSDQAFIDAWDAAIDMYGAAFSGITLVVTTGDGLPNLSKSGFTTPGPFKAECTVNMDMDCAAETTILSYFVSASAGGGNGKATQTSGMEASRVNLDLDVADVKLLTQNTMTMSSAATRILGGAQFNTRFSLFAVQEGCTSTFPPTAADKPAGCTIGTWATQGVVPVSCIPMACLAPGVTMSALEKVFTEFKQVPASDLISPEQAAYNVLELYFNGTPAATFFGGITGGEPLNYLQIYYEDIQYATNNASKPAKVVETGGTTVSETAQSMLNLASTKLFVIAETEP